MLDNAVVLVVDDHPVVRRGLRAMLENEPWIGGVVEAATGSEAVAAAAAQHVDVVVMDLVLPDLDGIETARRILASDPGVRVLMLTMSGDEETAARSFRVGVRGYLVKGTDPDLIISAIHTVAAGSFVLGPEVARSVLDGQWRATGGTGRPGATASRDMPGPGSPFDRLTPRERDVLTHLATGHANSEIARRLGASEKTVRNLVSSVLGKLGVSSRTQAVILARDAGLGSGP